MTMRDCLRRGLHGILGAILASLAPAESLGQGVSGPSMTVDSFSAVPAAVVVNAPAAVTFTATILHPSVLPTGVNLLKVDQAGRTLSIAGVMRDGGTDGDAAAGDKVFTIRLTVNEATVGRVYYRVSAAFKGVLQRVLSSTIAVSIDPFALPPDPGEAGKQTLAGIDSDKDGVRDDVQRWIAASFPNALSHRRALTGVSISIQRAIGSTDSVQDLAIQEAEAATCLTAVLSGTVGFKALNELVIVILNTSARQGAYNAYKAGIDIERVALRPKFNDASDSCNFDVAGPGN